MATEKYFPLANITLTSTASSVTFGSIPSGYRDLRLVVTGTITALTIPNFQINGTASTSFYYSVSAVRFSTSSVSSASYSGSETTARLHYESSANVGIVTYTIDFLDAAATDKHKTALSRTSDGNAEGNMLAHRFATTSAISSITLNSGSTNWGIGSTFELYGVA